MSYDISLWKWSEEKISPILCDLLLSEDIPVAEVDALDKNKLRSEIELMFPALTDMKSEFPIDYDIKDYQISISLGYSIANDAIGKLRKFALEFDLFLYDPQDISIYSDNEFKVQNEKYQKIKKEYFKKIDEDFDSSQLKNIQDRADKGDPDACVEIGNHYSFGELIKQDYRKAYKYYKLAADSENLNGIFNLASCYRLGQGVKKNIEEAIKLYLKILNEDLYFTAFELAEIYSNGEGPIKDLDKAVEYYKLSWNAGNSEAKRKLKALGIEI